MMKIEQEVKVFTKAMQHELLSNAHKGDWREFTNPNDILVELQYHHAKLLIAMRDRTKCSQEELPAADAKVLELAADCSNHYLFLINALDIISIDA